MAILLWTLVLASVFCPGLGKAGKSEDDQSCVCGVFNYALAKEQVMKEEPIFTSKFQMKKPCGAGCEDECQRKCVELTTAPVEQIAKLLCKTAKKDITGYQAAMLYKACGKEWAETGVKTTKRLCCKSGSPVKCT